MNVIWPLGAMPIKPLNVVWLLYVEKVSLCRTKEEGVWHLISVPSIITLVLGYLSLKDWGIALSIVSLSGQMLRWPNFKYRKLIQDMQILLIVDTCTLNLWAKSSSNNPSLILIRTIKNSSRVLSFRRLPGLFPRLISLVGNAGNSNSSFALVM